jgi:nitroimidazol reductase NimA-like FMN-containing flavoprotein (pyridoxamine 5'-phosphate oxidase superfamily)
MAPNGASIGSELVVLSEDECWELLATVSIGRVAVAEPRESPTVLPVNYVVDGRTIVFRSDEGSKLHELRHWPVSFEVDQIDSVNRRGWSVLVRGRPQIELGQYGHREVEPWATGEKRFWVRIVPTQITGRRLALPDAEIDSRGYR